MNRAVAVPAASIDAVKAVQASVIQFKNDLRGMVFASLAAAGGAAFGAGFGPTGAELAIVPTIGFGGTGGLDSSLLIGISSFKGPS